MGYFAESMNPQPEEIRQWAYDTQAEWPDQEFMLALIWARHEKAYLDLANDGACPRRIFFLDVVYSVVGKAVQFGLNEENKAIIKGFVDRGDNFDHPDIKKWQKRSYDLIANPSTFDNGKWCDGQLARNS